MFQNRSSNSKASRRGRALALIALAATPLVLAACEKDEPTGPGEGRDDKILVVNMKGTAVGSVREVPAIDGSGTTTGLCFDLPLIDPNTDRQIGTVTDCLSDVTPVGEGLAVVGTQFFRFADGTLVSRGLTTAQPKTHGSLPATHVTGAIPSPDDNDVLSGTGRYEGARGRVRLSGAVNLSRLAEHNEITWDCIFVIHLQ